MAKSAWALLGKVPVLGRHDIRSLKSLNPSRHVEKECGRETGHGGPGTGLMAHYRLSLGNDVP